jgi:hydrogenase-4 component F
LELLALIVIPLVAALVSFFIQKNIRVLSAIAVFAAVLELAAMTAVVMKVLAYGGCAAAGYFSVDALGSILLMLLAVVGAAASWYSTGYLKIEVEKNIIGMSRVWQYFILLHLFLFAMFFAVITTSPIFNWIAIETTTLSTAFLISFYNKPSAVEAAWKYLIINSVGLLCGFFGTLLFFYPTLRFGYKGFLTWQNLAANAWAFDPVIVKMAFVFVLIGYGTKVGLVPMHTWLPDAHSKAPAPISSLLSGVLLNVAFLAVLRFKSVTDAAIGPDFSGELLVFFGIASIVIAAFIIFIQKNYKRLLAYHSIEHMGIITLGFGFGGIGSFAGLLHMIYHSLAKSALFLSSGNILLKYSSTKMHNVQGMLHTLPMTSVLFFIGFLAMAGVPPFGIFFTEFSILSAGISAHPLITVIALLSLALVFAGILKHVVVMIFGPHKPEIPAGEAGMVTVIPAFVLISILTAVSIFVPDSLQSLLSSATMNR